MQPLATDGGDRIISGLEVAYEHYRCSYPPRHVHAR